MPAIIAASIGAAGFGLARWVLPWLSFRKTPRARWA